MYSGAAYFHACCREHSTSRQMHIESSRFLIPRPRYHPCTKSRAVVQLVRFTEERRSAADEQPKKTGLLDVDLV